MEFGESAAGEKRPGSGGMNVSRPLGRRIERALLGWRRPLLAGPYGGVIWRPAGGMGRKCGKVLNCAGARAAVRPEELEARLGAILTML